MTDEAPRITRSGSEKRQRSRLVQVRCTDDEFAQIEAAAERASLTVGAFMRRQCLGTSGPRAVRRPPVERAALAQMLGHLGKCRSNLNQIARVLNSGGDTPDGIPAAIAEFREACAAIMQALGYGSGEGQDAA
jgi:hypothetical protein